MTISILDNRYKNYYTIPMMKAELGYYLDNLTFAEVKVPIYGLRAVPTDICTRQWGDISYGDRHWQVEIIAFNDYVWINQARHLIFLY